MDKSSRLTASTCDARSFYDGEGAKIGLGRALDFVKQHVG